MSNTIPQPDIHRIIEMWEDRIYSSPPLQPFVVCCRCQPLVQRGRQHACAEYFITRGTRPLPARDLQPIQQSLDQYKKFQTCLSVCNAVVLQCSSLQNVIAQTHTVYSLGLSSILAPGYLIPCVLYAVRLPGQQDHGLPLP